MIFDAIYRKIDTWFDMWAVIVKCDPDCPVGYRWGDRDDLEESGG